MKKSIWISSVAVVLLSAATHTRTSANVDACAAEAAAFIEMAVSDGQSWNYATTVGNMVYQECKAKETKNLQ